MSSHRPPNVNPWRGAGAVYQPSPARRPRPAQVTRRGRLARRRRGGRSSPTSWRTPPWRPDRRGGRRRGGADHPRRSPHAGTPVRGGPGHGIRRSLLARRGGAARPRRPPDGDAASRSRAPRGRRGGGRGARCCTGSTPTTPRCAATSSRRASSTARPAPAPTGAAAGILRVHRPSAAATERAAAPAASRRRCRRPSASSCGVHGRGCAPPRPPTAPGARRSFVPSRARAYPRAGIGEVGVRRRDGRPVGAPSGGRTGAAARDR